MYRRLRNHALFGLGVGVTLAALSLVWPAKADPWTGPYAGAHVGYGWGDMSVKDIDGGVAPGPFNYSTNGIFGGGTLGYNYQLSGIVVGLEGDLGYMDLNGSKTIKYAPPDDSYHKGWSLDGGLYGDIAGRVGVLVTPAMLIYAKGGYGFYDGEGLQYTTKPWYKPTGTGMFSGAVYGGGVEYMWAENISVKIEYLHFDFGTEDGMQEKVTPSDPETDDGTPVGSKFHNRQSLDADSVKLGISYHF